MLKSVLSLVLAFSMMQTLSALDLMQQEKWISWHKAKITRVKEADGQTVIRITVPKSEKKSNYAAVDCIFPRPMNLSDFQELKMTIQSSQKIKVSMRINTRGGGNLFPGWSKVNADSQPKQFVFTRKEMKDNKNPDLKKAFSVTFGFGLWQYDTTKFPLEVELRMAKVVSPASGSKSQK